MFKNIYVKKLWSLNPDEYHFITLEEAIEKYKIYCISCIKYADMTTNQVKSFQEWLATEI